MYSTNDAFQTKFTVLDLLSSWQFVAIQAIVFTALAIWLQKPTGTLTGHIALERPGFGIYTRDLTGRHVCAIAIGPRGPFEQERGVWIGKDGAFRIPQLPVGEYQVKVRAIGFETAYQNGIFVDDGRTTDANTVELAAVRPSVSVATDRRVFTTNEAPAFWVNATACASTTVKIFQKEVLDEAPKANLDRIAYIKENSETNQYGPYEQLAHRKYGEWYADNLIDWTKITPMHTFQRTFQKTFDQTLSAQFKFDKPLPPGEYWMCVDAISDEGVETEGRMTWFMVTNLGMIVMRAPEKTVVRAIDLTTLKPVKGATVKRCNWAEGKPATALTDADGFVTFPALTAPVKTKADSGSGEIHNADTTFIEGSIGAHKAYDDVTFWTADRERYNTYMYTERPVYRLGQTAYFKGIVREKGIEGNKTPKTMSLKATVYDPDNVAVWTGKLKTNDLGTFHGAVDIPESGHTGYYRIEIGFPDSTKTSETFEVAEYRKPEYLVEVKPETPRVVAGEKMRAKVHATYFFGGPVANAHVKYSVYVASDYSLRYALKPRPTHFAFFDDWDGNDYSGSYGGDFLCDGEAQTDASGDATVEFDSKTISVDPKQEPSTSEFQDKRYKIEAEVTDMSRLTVTSSTKETATAGDFELFVTPDSWIASVGQPIGVTFEAIDYNGKPVANHNINVAMARILYDNTTYTTRGEQSVADITIKTGATGIAHAILPCGSWPSDTFWLSGTAKDARGHTIFNATSVWVANDKFPYTANGADAESKPVSIKLDKPIYDLGETAKALITAPVHGNEHVQAIVSVQGLKLYNYQVVDMDATSKIVEIPIKKEYAPNAYVSLAIVDQKHQFYQEQQELRVSPRDSFLNISIETDKPKYHPRDTVQYTIKAIHNDGTPAANTELSLGVVDESIYSIRPEAASDIRKAFYYRRENQVVTSCSFPEDYSGGPDKNEAQPVVRKDFKDVAAWIPDLKTDENGIAKARVTLPDNLTTWRATVRGVDAKTDVGMASQKILCSQDLVLRIALPRFFSQGDEGLITAVVHNYSDINQNIALKLKTSDEFASKTKADQILNIAPQQAKRFSWTVDVKSAGSATISVAAIGQGASDAMEQKLPVIPFGIPAFAAKAGLMTVDQQTVTIPAGLAGDAVRSGAEFRMSIASSTLGPVLGNFGALIDYPYGCTEQTMSKLIPSVVAMQLHTRLGQPLTKQQLKIFDGAYDKSIEKLSGYHHNDGGWGWWENDESNIYLTALVVDGMKLLTEAGYKPDPSFIKDGLHYLHEKNQTLLTQLTDPLIERDWWIHERRTDLAKSVYTESEFKVHPNKKMTEMWLKSVDRMSPETLSYLALAYKNTGNDSMARIFYDRLILLANDSNEAMNWEHSSAMIKKMHAHDKYRTSYWFEDYSYRFTGVETTALALKCVLKMEPDNTDRIEKIKKWIMFQKDNNGWQNTKTTAEVFMVLLEDELLARQRGGSGNFTARITLGEKEIQEFVANANDLYASQREIKLPVPEKPTSLVIEKNGSGRLYYNTLMTYFRNMKRGDVVADKAIPEGLRIKRKFYRLVPVALSSSGSTHFRTEEIHDKRVKEGETILMKVLVEAPFQLPYIQVDAPLPSGGEVVEDPSEDASVDSTNASPDETGSKDANQISGNWGQAWWTHKDVLDDKIVFFGTDLPQGKSEFHALIRMELPGKVGVNPVRLIGSYTDKVRGYSNIDDLIVQEAGK
jgi:uncharacterized protein YfaS (alpha-2-macroglobulin family)